MRHPTMFGTSLRLEPPLEPPYEPEYDAPDERDVREDMAEAFAAGHWYCYLTMEGKKKIYPDELTEACYEQDGYTEAHSQILLGNAEPMRAICETALQLVVDRVMDEAIDWKYYE